MQAIEEFLGFFSLACSNHQLAVSSPKTQPPFPPLETIAEKEEQRGLGSKKKIQVYLFGCLLVHGVE